MTVAIGLHLGSYIMLAADTRVTYYPFGEAEFYRDDREKVQRTNIGIVTGSGYVPLLDAVKARLVTDQILHTDDFLQIVREERQRITIPYGIEPERILRRTGWIFTYQTMEGDSCKLRLAIVHPALADGEEVVRYQPSDVALIAPDESIPEQADALQKLFREKMKPPYDATTLDRVAVLSEHLMHHWTLVAGVIKILKPNFPSISDKAQIGIHLLTGQRGISPITSIDNPNFSVSLAP